MSPVLSIEWHPRDIGTLLIAYQQSGVYSLVSGEVKSVLVYQLSKDHRGFQLASHIANGEEEDVGGSKEVIPKQRKPISIQMDYTPSQCMKTIR